MKQTNLPVLFCTACRHNKSMEWSAGSSDAGVGGPYEARCVRKGCGYAERFVTPDDVLWLHELAMAQKGNT